jgi:hypothetical protein
MQYQYDQWDDEWDKLAHTPDEYRREIRQLRERCAMYSKRIDLLEAELEKLRVSTEIKFVAGCAYPDCLDGDGRCHAMFKGECSGPKKEATI